MVREKEQDIKQYIHYIFNKHYIIYVYTYVLYIIISMLKMLCIIYEHIDILNFLNANEEHMHQL